MTEKELSQVRAIRTVYGQMMTNGYTHEHAIGMIIEANKADASESVLTRALWLDPSVPDCDPV